MKSAIKNKSGVVLRLSLNMVSDDETNLSHKFSLTNRQVANLRKAFANKSSTDIKLSKTQLSNVVQSEGFLGRFLRPLLKQDYQDAGIHKEISGSGCSLAPKTTALTISNDEMKDIIEIAKSLKDSGLLFKGVSETIQNEAKEQKGGFLVCYSVRLVQVY